MTDQQPVGIAVKRWPKRRRMTPEQKAAAKAERAERQAQQRAVEFASHVQALASDMGIPVEEAEAIALRYRDGEAIDTLAEEQGLMTTTLATHFITSGIGAFRRREYKRGDSV